MKNLLFFGILLLQVQQAFTLEIAWGEPVNGISLGLACVRSDFGFQEDVTLIAIFKNESPVEVRLPIAGYTADLRLIASDAARRPLPAKPPQPLSITGGNHRLDPGGSVGFKLN